MALNTINNLTQGFQRNGKTILILSITIAFHLLLLFFVTVNTGEKEKREENTVFKMVDVEEYIPPPPKKEEVVTIQKQEGPTEEVVEVEVEVVEVEGPVDPVYQPQHKISAPPIIPDIRSKIVYPTMANKQRIEGVVILELFIDAFGKIRKIEILKDPGYGFAEAATIALEGVVCTPAEANGVPVAVRFRYPVRFKLK